MPSINKVRACGDDLISIDVADAAGAQVLATNLRSSGDWLDVVGGIDSVVLQFDARLLNLAAALNKTSESLDFGSHATTELMDVVEIPVCYGGDYGPDIDTVCTQVGLSIDDVIALHTSGEYAVDMLGFTPGFAYVGGLDARLHVPRLTQPRVRVPAGSVGVAGEHTGLYALPGPGGWSLIGRTAYPLFDASAEEPITLHPGTRIRFVAADEL